MEHHACRREIIPAAQFFGGQYEKCIMVGYEEEKLLALRMYAEQRGVSVEGELAQAAEAMYQKVVPANVRAFVDMKVESQKPKRKGKDASASAVGD